MKIIFTNGQVFRSDGRFEAACDLAVENEKILAVGQDVPALFSAGWIPDETVDLNGKYLVPGLVDVHTHGRNGVDFTTASEDELQTVKRKYAESGVTSLFPTLASGKKEDWLRAIRALVAAGFDGIHLEGNFLNPSKRGAHPLRLLRPLDGAELASYLREIPIPCHVTAAYELDQTGEFQTTCRQFGATMGLGHTAATEQEATLALARGVTSFTHLFNTMPPLHHREGGAAAVGLASDCWVEMICDGLHVSPNVVKLSYRCKSRGKFVLITDSMAATGCPDGEYSIADQPVLVKNGRAQTFDGALAGSTLNLLDAVKNLAKFAQIPFAEALVCATKNPAEMVGIGNLVGSLDAGKRADLLVLNEAYDLAAVYAGGHQIK